jgi:hypothetical protein
VTVAVTGVWFVDAGATFSVAETSRLEGTTVVSAVARVVAVEGISLDVSASAGVERLNINELTISIAVFVSFIWLPV